jgi:membrane protein DedA with SNARE-associated domain
MQSSPACDRGGRFLGMTETLEFVRLYGLLVLFVWVFADQAGIPIPVVPMLLGAGALAGAAQMSFGLALAVAVGASLLADLLWYAIGRRRGAPVLRVLCWISLETDHCVRRAQSLFVRNRVQALLLAKFLPGVNPVAATLSGVVGTRLGSFIAYDTGSALVWAGTWTGLGYVASSAIETVARRMTHLGGELIAALAVAFAGYASFKYMQRWRFIRQLRIARVYPEEVKAKLDTGESVTIVDLRTALDVSATPYAIPGVLRIEVEELERRLDEIPRDRDIVLYCS